MFISKDTVTEALNYIIQYADDIDVGNLLKNCKFRLNNREPRQKITDKNLMSNKELLLYIQSNKQIFIAFDKQDSYTEKAQKILAENAVLKLAPNGKELFGKSWG